MNIDAALASLEQRKNTPSPASMVSSLLGDGIASPSDDDSELSDDDIIREVTEATVGELNSFAPVSQTASLPTLSTSQPNLELEQMLATKALLLEQSEKDLVVERRKRMETEQRLTQFEHTLAAKNSELADEHNKRIAAEVLFNTKLENLSATNRTLELSNNELNESNEQLRTRLRQLESSVDATHPAVTRVEEVSCYVVFTSLICLAVARAR